MKLVTIKDMERKTQVNNSTLGGWIRMSDIKPVGELLIPGNNRTSKIYREDELLALIEQKRPAHADDTHTPDGTADMLRELMDRVQQIQDQLGPRTDVKLYKEIPCS